MAGLFAWWRQATPVPTAVAIAGRCHHIGAITLPKALAMTITLSIKNVPDELAKRLRERAARNHRSLQGELMAIIEEATRHPPQTIREFAQFVDQLGIKTPSDSARMVREDRDDPSR
jgi:plasmid stability protein